MLSVSLLLWCLSQLQPRTRSLLRYCKHHIDVEQQINDNVVLELALFSKIKVLFLLMPDLLDTPHMKPCYNCPCCRTTVFQSLSKVNLPMVVIKYVDPIISRIQCFSFIIHIRKSQKETLSPYILEFYNVRFFSPLSCFFQCTLGFFNELLFS